jgi:beta-amylase
MLNALAAAANSSGNPYWGHGGPNNAGTYNSLPYQTGFFADGTNDNYASAYGKFFLNWYFSALLAHGDAILAQANQIFGSQGVNVGAKVSGIHWWYQSDSHAAEATAGYLNTDQVNAYLQVILLFIRLIFIDCTNVC